MFAARAVQSCDSASSSLGPTRKRNDLRHQRSTLTTTRLLTLTTIDSNASFSWLQAFIYKHKRLPTHSEYGETKFAGGQCDCSYTGQCAFHDHPLMKNFSNRPCDANMLRDVIKNDRKRDSYAISPKEAVPAGSTTPRRTAACWAVAVLTTRT